MERGAGERDVRDVAHALVGLARRDQVGAAAGQHLPGLVEVEQRRAEGVDIAVARTQHPVVEEQPPLRRLDGHGAGADLHALPGRLFERGGRHHVAVAPPEAEVGRLRVEDVAEGRVSRVARAREHGVVAVDLAGEHHTVAVIGQEGVFQLVEGLEVLGPRHADCRAVVAVAPRDIVFVADFRHARVVAVDPLAHFGVGARESEVLLPDVPFQSVDREAHVDAHAAVGVVAAEDPGVVVLPFFKRYDRRVEDRIRRRQRMAADDRVGRVAPHDFVRARGAILPRHVRKRRTRNCQVVHLFGF